MIVSLSKVICELESGSRPKGGVKDGVGNVASLGAEHLDSKGGFNFKKVKFVPDEFFKKQSKGIINRYDILIVKDGATTAKVSYVDDNFPYNQASINEHLFRIKVNTKVALARYVFWYLFSDYGKKQILSDFRGATVGGISRGFLDKTEIPLPSLDEQQRIVELLDHADSLRQKRKQAIELLDQYLKSVFLDMFGEIKENPHGLETTKLENITLKITDGTHQPPKFTEEGIPFIFISNITNNEIDLHTKKFISRDTYDELTRRTPIERNDILYTTVGSYGNPAIVKTTEKFCFQRHIAHIKPDHEKTNLFFLYGMLNSPSIKTQADNKVKGIAQKTLNLSDLKQFDVFLPPFELQNKFANIVQNTENLRKKMLEQSEELDNQFQALMQKSFRQDA